MGTLAAGIKEIFATAKTTGSNVMLCGNDGTPDGHMTMANLASELGVTQQEVRETDLNILRAGLYWTAQAEETFQTYHYPSKEWGMLIVLDDGHGSTKQIHFGLGGANYERYKYNNGGWSDWRLYAFNVPTFYNNYADLSSLASAVGGVNPSSYPSLGTNQVDWDNFNPTGNIYTIFNDTYGNNGATLNGRLGGLVKFGSIYLAFCDNGGIYYSENGFKIMRKIAGI